MDVPVAGNLTKAEKQPVQTEPGAASVITKCSSDFFFCIIIFGLDLEKQVKECKSILLTKVPSQHKLRAHQLFCLDSIDPL